MAHPTDGHLEGPPESERASTPSVSDPDMGKTSSDGVAVARCKLPVTMGVPPHIHELMTRASIQLLAEKQRWHSPEPHNADEPLGQSRYGDSLASGRHSKGKELARQNASHELVPISKCKGSKIRPGRSTFAWNLTIPAGPGYSYSHTPNIRFGDQQSDPHRRVQIQINYMDSLAARIPDVSSFAKELRAKESLRTSLKNIAQETLELYGKRLGFPVGPKAIDLKCFGGLRNGFSLPGADLKLVICKRLSTFPEGSEIGYLHTLEKAFLDAGLGARMMPGVTGPVITLRENPPKRLLSKLRSQCEERESRETQNEDPGFCSNSSKISERSLQRGNSRQPSRSHGPKGVIIQCNTDLSQTLSIHSTELLRCYALCDERVRQVGVFVKMWAKARGICNPHRGTMCSYGYILMVIHYLMDIAQPPLVPNLQSMSWQFPGHYSATTVNGCEVQYYSDERVLRSRATYNAKRGNRQSVGDLLRGFFAYYGSSGRDAPLRGFDWIRNTVSIRTPGGTLPKRDKGWYTAKTDGNGNWTRYLLAVEDPFEYENNVAGSVTKAGVWAIRTEFCRACTIIQRVQEIPGAGWEWRTSDGDIGEDFLANLKGHPTRDRTFSRVQDNPVHYQDGKQLDDAICDSTSHNPDFLSPSTELRASNGPLTATSGYRKHRDSLIHPAAAANGEHQRICREDFRQEATLSANNMRRLLDAPEIQNTDGQELTRRSTDQSVDRNYPNGRPISVDPGNSRVAEVSVEPASSNAILPQQSISAISLQSHGIVLDSRQFYSPDAIRNRSLCSRWHLSEEENHHSESASMDSSTSGVSGIPEHDMLLTLPYHEGSVS